MPLPDADLVAMTASQLLSSSGGYGRECTVPSTCGEPTQWARRRGRTANSSSTASTRQSPWKKAPHEPGMPPRPTVGRFLFRRQRRSPGNTSAWTRMDVTPRQDDDGVALAAWDYLRPGSVRGGVPRRRYCWQLSSTREETRCCRYTLAIVVVCHNKVSPCHRRTTLDLSSKEPTL